MPRSPTVHASSTLPTLLTRRSAMAVMSVAGLMGLGWPQASAAHTLRFGLTPVFLTNDLELLSRLRDYLHRETGHDVSLVQRRTYQEITALLLSGQLDAAWICGYPYVAHRDQLALVAAPLWRGQPRYQSYILVAAGRPAERLDDLEGDIHAFSDPDSNSGHLVTRAALSELGRRPEEFFKRTIFTYSHRNVVRAVGSGLAASGSVDGYVWEVIHEIEPELTSKTRILRRSEPLGFPPVACPRAWVQSPGVVSLKQALLRMSSDAQGREILAMLRLDGFAEVEAELFDGIAGKLAQVRSLG